MKTPIVFIIFRRPAETERVFETIRQAKPSKLFIIADGPRKGKPGEEENCQLARKVIDSVDWPCDVIKNYSDTNLGCAKRVSTGLDWVFKQVDRAIILEDDCVPDPSLFPFFDELLEKYKDENQIFSITGHNHLGEWQSKSQSYFFSNYFDCWGWATWRRVWQNFDPDMKLWADPVSKEKVKAVIGDTRQFRNRERVLEAAYQGKIDSWAYPFFFTSLLHSGLTITPSVNLIENIGFGADASNTNNARDHRSKLKRNNLNFPLKHPQFIDVDREYDYQRYKKVWQKPLARRVVKYLKSMLLSK